MTSRISSKSFDTRIMGMKVHVETCTLEITDNTAVAMNNGRPNGHVRGDVTASGEMVLDHSQLLILTAAAKTAGSWQNLPTFTIDAYATGTNPATGLEVNSIRAFGCKFKLSSLLNIDQGSNDKSTITLPFDVTSPDFVWINGVPYLDESDFSLL